MSRSRRETLTDLLNADKAAKSDNVGMADTATIDTTNVETLSEAKVRILPATKAADEESIIEV